MKLQNKTIKIAKPNKISVEYLEKEIKNYGEPLRWSIVKIEENELIIDATIKKLKKSINL